ncbi:hypothetical protein CTI14_65605, partial [Methylobacterium radiotolerans]
MTARPRRRRPPCRKSVLDHLGRGSGPRGRADAEPSLAAPENHEWSQVVRMRGADDDRETEAPETALPEV